MNLQAYLDESSDSKFFVLAGYIATPKAWAEFARDWEEILHFATRGPDGRHRFKMSEMAHNGRMADVPIFYRVIEKHVQSGVSVAFQLDHLSSALSRITLNGAPIDWGLWRNPYIFAVRALTDFLNRLRDEIPSAVINQFDGIDFYFDERKFEKTVIIPGWEEIKKGMPPEMVKLYGATPKFEKDEDYLPLQAADLWAWWVRRWAADCGSVQPWGALPWDVKGPMCAKWWLEEDGMIAYLVSQNSHFAPRGRSLEIKPKT